MQNILSLKKEFVLLITGLLLVILAMNAAYVQTIVSSKPTNAVEIIPTPTPDPSLDLVSLDNALSFTLPASWQKADHLDPSGLNTYIKLTSPEFNSPEPGVIDSGVGIIIGRVYNLNAADSLKTKLNASYDLDTYNVMPIQIGDQNAMTMHKEGLNINARIIYVATQNHLWDITITSKSLEDEARHQSQIDFFLDSINFKN